MCYSRGLNDDITPTFKAENFAPRREMGRLQGLSSLCWSLCPRTVQTTTPLSSSSPSSSRPLSHSPPPALPLIPFLLTPSQVYLILCSLTSLPYYMQTYIVYKLTQFIFRSDNYHPPKYHAGKRKMMLISLPNSYQIFQ